MNILTKIISCGLIISIALVAGCRKASAPGTTASAPPDSNAPATQLAHPAGGTTPAPTAKYFKGSIGTSLDLQMKLVRNGDQLTGSYFYQKIGTKIDLRGSVDKDGNLQLEEFDSTGKQTGVFKGMWKVDPGDGLVSLAGNWSKPPDDKGGDKKIAFSVHEEAISFTGDVELVSKQIKESNKKLMYEISAQYPQLSGGTNPGFEKFNQLVHSSVTKKVAMFKKEMAPEEGEEPRPEGSMGSDLSIGYTVALAQDDLLSVHFDVSSYYMGAAHPNSYSEVVNYDLKNGKQLKLGDLFKPGVKYLPAISTYCISDLKKQAKEKGADGMLEDSSIEKGASPSADNYQSWTITKKGIGINFDSYQVAPYAAGPQFVNVPYSTLKDLINPDAPIGQFVK
jgi:Protein of unknown function (DUF3298)/Deacetylase PdaC